MRAPRRRPGLNPEWRQAWRKLSTVAGVLGTTATAWWIALPDDQRAAVLAWLGLRDPAHLVLAGFVALAVKNVLAIK